MSAVRCSRALLARLRPASGLGWPLMEGTVKADSLVLGPVTLRDATATVRIVATGAEITALDAGVLGGSVHGIGTLTVPVTNKDLPAYTFDGQFQKLSPAAVGQLVSLHWSGGSMEANGKIELSGFTEKDLTASAKGALHFDWQHGVAGGARGLFRRRWLALTAGAPMERLPMAR